MERRKSVRAEALIYIISGLLWIMMSGLPVRAGDIQEEPSHEEPELTQEINSYQELSKVLSIDSQEDSFGTILVDSEDTRIIKDGESGRLEEEYDTSIKEAKQAISSRQAMEEYLKEADPETIYQVETEEDGDIKITAPYQTKRLIVEGQLSGDDTLGACSVYYNKPDHETILEFDTDKETKSAYKKACNRWGSQNCFVDEIYYYDDLGMSEESVQLPAPGTCWSWGNRYMKMNYLKTQAAYYGYTKQVTVAVIDSGISRSNPIFAGERIAGGGWNFAAGSSNINDTVGHGSHVAGIIADATPPNVKLLVLKVTDSRGRASLYVIKSALRYAIKKRVQVINLSMGVTGKKAAKYTYLDKLIKKAYKLGIPICAAAGNDGSNVKYSYPANKKLPITVAAINANGKRGSYVKKNGKRFYYSNYGNTIDFAAPGTNIISAGSGDGYWSYYYMTGTSMAAPHVSAAAAYLKLRNPGMSVSQLEKLLKSMSHDLGKKGKDKYFGWGCPVLDNFFTRNIDLKSTVQKNAAKKTVQLTAVSKISVKRRSNSKILIKWKKSKGASGYQIRYSSSKSMKNKKTAKAKTPRKQLINLRGTYCYYQIRALKTVRGKTYYSGWSRKKKIRLK